MKMLTWVFLFCWVSLDQCGGGGGKKEVDRKLLEEERDWSLKKLDSMIDLKEKLMEHLEEQEKLGFLPPDHYRRKRSVTGTYYQTAYVRPSRFKDPTMERPGGRRIPYVRQLNDEDYEISLGKERIQLNDKGEHIAKNPKFDVLLNQLKPIIPGKFKQEEPTNREKDLLFVKNILTMLRTLAAKMKRDDKDHDPKKAKDLIGLQKMATELIEEIASTGGFDKSKMLALMKALEAFYNDDDGEVKDRAPFCEVGEDCFSDVDHKLIAMEIKRLALSVTRYMKDRMMEEERPDSDQRSPLERALAYKTDAVLTQTTTVLAQLHRAILRNWHHIMMIIGNLAGNNNKTVGPRRPLRRDYDDDDSNDESGSGSGDNNEYDDDNDDDDVDDDYGDESDPGDNSGSGNDSGSGDYDDDNKDDDSGSGSGSEPSTDEDGEDLQNTTDTTTVKDNRLGTTKAPIKHFSCSVLLEPRPAGENMTSPFTSSNINECSPYRDNSGLEEVNGQYALRIDKNGMYTFKIIAEVADPEDGIDEDLIKLKLMKIAGGDGDGSSTVLTDTEQTIHFHNEETGIRSELEQKGQSRFEKDQHILLQVGPTQEVLRITLEINRIDGADGSGEMIENNGQDETTDAVSGDDEETTATETNGEEKDT